MNVEILYKINLIVLIFLIIKLRKLSNYVDSSIWAIKNAIDFIGIGLKICEQNFRKIQKHLNEKIKKKDI